VLPQMDQSLPISLVQDEGRRTRRADDDIRTLNVPKQILCLDGLSLEYGGELNSPRIGSIPNQHFGHAGAGEMLGCQLAHLSSAKNQHGLPFEIIENLLSQFNRGIAD